MKRINKTDIIIFAIIFIITCIIFIPFLQGHYATDTYNIANIGYKEYAIEWSLKDGRIFMCIIGLIASKINMPIKLYVFITLFLALVISNISVIILSKIIKKYKEPKKNIQKIIVIVISYITIFNFMYLEDMYFVESIVMASSILLFMISAYILTEKNKQYILKSLILNIIGIMCYQGTIGMFFSFTILFTILKNKNNVKQIIIDLIKCGVIALVAVLLNIIAVKIIGNILKIKQTRLSKISKIFSNIEGIIATLPTILQKTCNLFPKNAFIIFLDIITIIVIIYQIKDIKKANNLIYKYVTIMVIAILGSCVTYLLSPTSFFTGRLRNPIGSLIGMIFIFLYVETNLFEKKKILSIITYLTLISYIALNFGNYENIMFQHKKINELEKLQVSEIDNKINEYEKNTGIKVTKIVKVPRKKTSSQNKGANDITRNALKTRWAVDGVINFYTERNLENIDATEEKIKYYFKNYDYEREYKCIDDTLYINVYVF